MKEQYENIATPTQINVNILNDNNSIANAKSTYDKFFVKITTNSSIGYALPIFRYNGEVFSKMDVIRESIDLENNIDELKTLFDDIKKHKIVIFDIMLNEKKLLINYNYYKL